MLRTFHRFQKHVAGFVLIAAIALAMSGFGMRLFQPKQNNGAITIDDIEVSLAEFYREVRDTERQYRDQYGKNFEQIAAMFHLNIPEQVKDRLIAETLIDREATRLDLHVGTEEWANTFRDQVLPMGYTNERYKELLAARNVSQVEFENDLRNNILRLQFTGLLKDASRPSILQSRMLYERSESKYALRYLEIDPLTFEKQAPQPSDEDVQKYYDDHQADFELPARVSYDYVVFKPENFLDKVQIQQDEVDFMYTDTPSKYSTPEMIKVRQIQIDIPEVKKDEAKKKAGSDPAAEEEEEEQKAEDEKNQALVVEARKKAEDVLAKAKAGTPFELLSVQFSDDKATKNNGGDLGWIARGKMSAQFDDAAFAVAGEGFAGVVETDKSFHIIKVEGHKPSELKKKEEVQSEIEAEIRKREAPSYASAKAQELYDQWTKTKQPLGEIAQKSGLSLASTSGLVSKEKDPAPDLRNMSSEVIDMPEEQKELLVELPSLSALVQVKDRKEIEVQPLSEVKVKIVESLRRQSAIKSAKSAAEQALQKLAAGEYGNIDAAAKALDVQVKEEKDLSPAKAGGQGLFADRDLRRAVFALSRVGSYPSKVVEVTKKYYLFQISEFAAPSNAPDAATLSRYFTQQENAATQELLASTLARLRYESKIDVSPAVMAQ